MATFPILESPNTITPAAAASVAVTPGASAWAFGAYAQIIAAAASDLLITGLALDPAPETTLVEAYEIQIAIGGAGVEVPIATIPSSHGNGQQSAKVNLVFPFPIEIAAGARVTARARRQGGGTAAYGVALLTVPSTYTGRLYPTSAPIKAIPTGAILSVPSSGVTWTSGAITELSAALPTDAVIFMIMAAPTLLAWAAAWELDILIGPAASETLLTTIRESQGFACLADPAWHPLPAPMFVAAGTRLSLRLRISAPSSVDVIAAVCYYEAPGGEAPAHQRATLPAIVIPPAADPISVTSGASETWGDWVEVLPAASQSLAVVDVVSHGFDIDAHVQVGIGPEGEEAPIATLYEGGQNANFTQTWIPLPLAIARIPAGARVSLRRRNNDVASAKLLSLIAIPSAGIGAGRKTTAASNVLPDDVTTAMGVDTGLALVGSGAAWTNGAWTEFTATGLEEDSHAYGLGVSAIATQYEIDLGIGPAGSEVIAYTWRNVGDGAGRTVLLSDALIPIATGTRVALRVRSATGGSMSAAILYYGAELPIGQVVIGGVDYTRRIEAADFELVLNRQSTADISLGDEEIPARFSDVLLYDRLGLTPIFGGIVWSRDIDGMTPSNPANRGDIHCVDYSVYFDDASVTLSYAAPVALEDVITDMVDQILGQYGLFYTPVATGFMLDPFAWVDVIVSDAFRQIADKLGVAFRTDPLAEILVIVPLAETAPIAISDADPHAADVKWTDGAKRPANTVILKCGPSGPGVMSQQWIADGIETSWVTDLPAIDPPPILVEIDDGVTPYLATVVPTGTPGGMFVWDRDTHTLSLGTDPVPSAGTKITLGPTVNFNSPFTYYTVQFPFVVKVTTGATPPITYRESRPDLIQYGPALEVANGILARESVERKDLEVLTDDDGCFPGQALDVNITSRGGIVATFLIGTVRGHIVNADHWEYTLSAQQAERYQGSYVEDWKALTSGGSGSASAAEVTAPISPPLPAGVIQSDGSVDFTADQSMGGNKLTDVDDPTSAQDAATKAYVDAAAPSGVILADGSVDFTGDQSMGGFALTDLEDPTNAQDAATKAYADSVVGGGGALTQIAQIVTSGSQATVDFTSIPGGYSALIVEFFARDTQGGTNSNVMRVRLNNDATSGNYTAASYVGFQNTGGISGTVAASASGVFCAGLPQDGNTAGITNAYRLHLTGYADATFHKRILSIGCYEDGTTNLTQLTHSARWQSAAAINRITFLTDGTAFKDGSTFTLYGVS
jgi:hypothetical protein